MVHEKRLVSDELATAMCVDMDEKRQEHNKHAGWPPSGWHERKPTFSSKDVCLIPEVVLMHTL